MPQPKETRPVSGGIDTDSAPEKVEAGDVLNAVNVRALRQKGQIGGRREWIPGNTEVIGITSLLPAGTNTLLGKCVDDATGTIYLFLHNSNGDHIILRYVDSTGQYQVVFQNAMVTGGLGWTADMFIACDAVDGLLLWCDGLHDQRYLSLTGFYSILNPIAASQLTLVQEPGLVPPTQVRVGIVGGISTIQYTPLQFAYRFSNQDGLTSVLSPLSDTALPSRQSDVASLNYYGNAVTVTIPVSQKIPGNWQRVELIARYLESNVYYVIKRWDRDVSADVTAVNSHNATTTPLTLTEWLGDTLETVDEKTAAKQFDNNPRAPKYQKPAANRNILGNFVEGYDTPAAHPTISTSTSTYTPTTPSYTPYTPYMVVVEKKDTRDWYFAIIVRFGSKNYLLPKECSIGKFYFNNNTIPDPTSSGATLTDGIFQLPQYISRESLIELKESGDPLLTGGPLPGGSPSAAEEVRRKIVAEANSLGVIVSENSGGPSMYVFPVYQNSSTIGSVRVEVTPSEYGPSSKSRGFLNGVAYNRGLQFYDGAGRKSGVIDIGTTTIPVYDASAPSFTEKITSTTPTGTQATIPDWAEYFSLTLSRGGRAQRFGFFFGGIIKALFKRGDGTVVYGDKSELVTPPSGKTVYGIGIPIPPTFKYDFVAGDYILFSVPGGVTPTGRANILAVYNGMIVVQYTTGMQSMAAGYAQSLQIEYNTGSSLNEIYLVTPTGITPKTAITIISGSLSGNNQYEVAAFGQITGSAGAKAFGNFFTTGTHSIEISGDAHTQIRTSDSGGGTGLAMSTRDDNGQLTWINDLGRSTPTDSVGQKALTNATRWSNTRVPGAAINGYGSFDAEDIKTTDITAGDITAMALTTRGAQDGGQLLVLCQHGSFAALIGQQQISGADGKNAFTAAGAVIGEFNALRGQWGCQSPRAVISNEGKTHWVDVYKRAIVEFNESGAGNVALYKTARLWDRLLGAVTNAAAISLGVDPFTGCLMVSLPAVSVTPVGMPGFESVTDVSDAVNGSVRTWFYDWTANKWVHGYTSGAEMMHCGNSVYGWKDGKLWKEFAGTAGTYYGVAQQAILAIPFNEGPPAIKSPTTLKLSGAAPAATRLLAGTGSAITVPYRAQEGANYAAIMRNRIGGGATTNAAYALNGVKGFKLKGATIIAVLYWSGGTAINLQDATLTYDVSAGH